MRGLIGKKIGMTRVFDSNGRAIPVTVLEAGPCQVTQVKSNEKDGYESVQVGFHEANICLLYTSPSPRDRSVSRMPSSA